MRCDISVVNLVFVVAVVVVEGMVLVDKEMDEDEVVEMEEELLIGTRTATGTIGGGVSSPNISKSSVIAGGGRGGGGGTDLVCCLGCCVDKDLLASDSDSVVDVKDFISESTC